MEHACYKCGQIVDEGVVFCPHCAAPQIRVMVAEAAAGAAAVALSSDASVAVPSSTPLAGASLSIRWSQAVRPCAVAGLIAALAMVFRLVVPPIAVLGAGFLAVAIYRRRNPDHAVRAGSGARLGALCGVFCFGLATVLGAIAVAVLRKGEVVRQTLLDAIQQAAARYPDPQTQSTLDFMRSPAGLLMMLVFVLIFVFLTFLLLGTLGGALGGLTFGRRDKG
jgi:hypothetical protein